MDFNIGRFNLLRHHRIDMDICGMVYGFGGEFKDSRLRKYGKGIHRHSVVHRLWCWEFHRSWAHEEDWFVDLDGFDMAIRDSESSKALQAWDDAGNTFGLEGLDEA